MVRARGAIAWRAHVKVLQRDEFFELQRKAHKSDLAFAFAVGRVNEEWQHEQSG